MPIIKIPRQYLIDQNEEFITVDVPASVVSLWRCDYAKVAKAKGLLKHKRRCLPISIPYVRSEIGMKVCYRTNKGIS